MKNDDKKPKKPMYQATMLKCNKHNYAEIARMCGLRYKTSDPVVGKILKPKPITKEDEERVAKKLAEYRKPKRLYKGYKNRKEYNEATPESRKRREIIHELGEEGKRIRWEEHQKWLNSKKGILIDIVTPRNKGIDKVDDHVWNNMSKQDQRYYNTFNLLWNRGILKEGNLNPISYQSKLDPKYDYTINGTYFKDISNKKAVTDLELAEYIKDIKRAAYRAKFDVIPHRIDRNLLEKDKDEDDGLGNHGDDAHDGYSTRWIEEKIGTEHPDAAMRTEGLIDVDIAKGIAEHDGVQTAVLYLSNVYAEDADFSTLHLVNLNCVRFATSVAQITSEARRRNDRATYERRTVPLSQLDQVVNHTSEKVVTYANSYVRNLQTRYKNNYKVMIKRVVSDLKTSLNKTHNNSVIACEMILINYGLILAALYKKVNNNKRTKNERKN